MRGMTLIMCMVTIRFIANTVSKYYQCITAPPCLEYFNYMTIQTVLPAISTRHSYLRKNCTAYRRYGGVGGDWLDQTILVEVTMCLHSLRCSWSIKITKVQFWSSVPQCCGLTPVSPTQMLPHPCSGSPKSKRSPYTRYHEEIINSILAKTTTIGKILWCLFWSKMNVQGFYWVIYGWLFITEKSNRIFDLKLKSKFK